MKGLALIDLQKVLWQIKKHKDKLIKAELITPKLEKINNLISQLEIKMKNT